MLLAMTVSVLAAVGAALILGDVMRVPSYAASRAMNSLGRKQNRRTNPAEVYLRSFSNWLAGKLRMNAYRRRQLEIDLQCADRNESPEQYMANAMVKAALIGVFGIPVWFLSPVCSLLLTAVAVTVYCWELGKVGRQIKEKRKKIEYELPGLVFHIEKLLCHSRDVLGMLDTYQEMAGKELKRELEITTADMRSGNYEAALVRLEARVGSSMLSDVIRGLIGVIRGDDTSVYWGTLTIRFSDHQRQMLKAEAAKAPKKVRRLSMALLICFMLIYIVVIGSVLMNSLGGLLTW